MKNSFISTSRVIWFILVIIWMSVIFSFSAKEAEESTEESTNFGRIVCSIFVPGYDNLTDDEQYELAKDIEYPIRKCAHAAEYMLLGLLLAGALYVSSNSKMWNVLLPFCIGSVYSVTDELHQFFVPGRSCRFTDILIDSFGIIVGVVIYYKITKVCSSYFMRRKSQTGGIV